MESLESAGSLHFQTGRRSDLLEALADDVLVRGPAQAVWPPRPLPPGYFLSPIRRGWISLWSTIGPLDDTRIEELCASADCRGLRTTVHVESYWSLELFPKDGGYHRLLLPQEPSEYEMLRDLAYEDLRSAGIADPERDELRFARVLDRLAHSEEYREALAELRSLRPAMSDLTQFLPKGMGLQQAWDLLTALDREPFPAPSGALPCLERFTRGLGIADAGWDPAEDLEALSEGAYDLEGLPDGWRGFLLLPANPLRVL